MTIPNLGNSVDLPKTAIVSSESNQNYESAPNTLVSVQLSGIAGYRVVITGYTVSSDRAIPAGAVRTFRIIDDGNGWNLERLIVGEGPRLTFGLDFVHPIRGPRDGSVTIELPALGLDVVGAFAVRFRYEQDTPF